MGLRLSITPQIRTPVPEATKVEKCATFEWMILDGMYAKVLKDAPIRVDEDITRIYFTTIGDPDRVKSLSDFEVRKLGTMYKSAIECFIVDCYTNKIERVVARMTELLKTKDDVTNCIRVPRSMMRLVNELVNDEMSVMRIDRRRFAIEELTNGIILAATHKNMRTQFVPLDSVEMGVKLAEVLQRGVKQELAQTPMCGVTRAIQETYRYVQLGYYLELTRYYRASDVNEQDASFDGPWGTSAVLSVFDPSTVADHYVDESGRRGYTDRGQYRGLQPWHVLCMDHRKVYETIHESKMIHPDVSRMVTMMRAIRSRCPDSSCCVAASR